MNISATFFYAFLSVLLLQQAAAQENATYKLPPKSIQELVDAPAAQSVLFNEQGTKALILTPPAYPSLAEISQPVLGLAGLKVNPANCTTEGEVAGVYRDLMVKDIANGKEEKLNGLTGEYRIGNLRWSPDGTSIAFSNEKADGVELWYADLQTLEARKLSNDYLNDIIGNTLQWTPDGKAILAQFINKERGPVPVKNIVPSGPIVQENLGKKTPARTYQYLLKDQFDQQLMDYYLTSQLQLVSLNGDQLSIGSPAIYREVSYSPNGHYLLVETVKKPYSYLVPISSFPTQTSVLDAQGNLIKELFLSPLAENQPIGYDVVPEGPRHYSWRADAPATLIWTEALDGGKGAKDATYLDAVFALEAPFTGTANKLLSLNYRFGGINWGNGDYALVRERLRRTRKEKISLFNPNTGEIIKVIADRSSEDTYTDPGRFLTTDLDGHPDVLLFDKGKTPTVFTIGNGASPQGDRPFLMKWNLLTGKQDTLFRSKAPYFEEPRFYDHKNDILYFSRESVEDVANIFYLGLKGKKEGQLTNFQDPYPSLKGVQKQLLSYPRKDGIKLTATLYLPKGYKKEDGRLPVLIWAYPREYKTAAAAGEVKGSPYRFTRLAFRSPVFWVTRGYAVLDNADMPIVGEGTKEPNDTFVEQIIDNANAIINYVVDMGVADRNRIAVGGHSYGAFMTANLLAHTDLFAAGIARSGAYNRTLTPFGFQNETRTYWQAPDVYYNMSPFSYADKIKTPLLMTHGIDDDNSGTFPIQSERLYSAIKGHGGTVRLVLLPKEFHGYRSRESIMHTFYEQDAWLEKYVKNRPLTSN